MGSRGAVSPRPQPAPPPVLRPPPRAPHAPRLLPGGRRGGWGVRECQRCPGDNGDTEDNAVSPGVSPCPPGFQRLNGTCQDIDECQQGALCRRGLCTNTRGGFTCRCPPGFLLDSARAACISQQVLSEARGPCFRVLGEGRRCALPTLRNITRQICCCSRVGKAWGGLCERCPPFGSAEFREICPAGPGYHYSASDLRIDTRYLGPDVPDVPGVTRVTSGRPRNVTLPPGGVTPVSPPVPTRPPLVPPPPEVVVVPRGGLQRPPPTQAAPRPACPPGVCGPGRCVPRAGGSGYSCVCNPGYWLSTHGTHCTDVDECAQSPAPCAPGRCHNLPGTFRCHCPQGYDPGDTGTRCQDVDECVTGSSCGPHGRCVNTEGSFECHCHHGYRAGDSGGPCEDVNECLEGEFCFPHGECVNTPGSYGCVCAPGYGSPALGGACEDIDECQRGDVCAGGTCVNTDGSFECRCPPGFRTDVTQAQCHDLDECQEYGDTLCGDQRCDNIPGSYRCVTRCHPGYREGDSGDCVDVDECQEYGDTLCGDQRCDNVPGSYRCVTPCDPGYREGDSGDCVDEDECSNATLCGPHATCHNVPGSFRCHCHPGYRPGPHDHSCQDEDECLSVPPPCGPERCQNLPGSFRCLCRDGRQHYDPDTARCAPPAPQNPSREPQLPPQEPQLPPWDPQPLPQEPQLPPREPQTPPREPHLPPWQPQNPPPGPQIPPPGPQPPAREPQPAPQEPQLPPWEPQNPPPGPRRPGREAGACYSASCRLLAANVTRAQCCCTLGGAWGPRCPPATGCPRPGTGDHVTLCPHGPGRVPMGPQGAPQDVDECALFSPPLCRGGLCLDSSPGFRCFCPTGFYYEPEQLECVDIDECSGEAAPCPGGGECINTLGSFRCACAPPLVLDPAQRRCVPNDTHLGETRAVCWQEVGADLVCGSPRLAGPVTYGECCCLFGQAWGMECALCPSPHTDDFELLCNTLRPPHPPRVPPQFPPPDIYFGGAQDFFGGGHNFLGGGRDFLGPPTPLDYEPYFLGGVGYVPAPPRYEGRSDFGDPSLAHRPRGPRFEPPPRHQPHGGGPEEDEEDEEPCGVLSGCHHGRCVRVPDGFTCVCDPGFSLDPADLECRDADECSHVPPPCLPGRCLNTPGSFRCLCPTGYAPPPPPAPPRCLPRA
ncbi:LOW QUALITY PROTEIN: latent-transforming growth factor beta-binding protein 4 [Patagioenas fasciata]|uniref:LOW QUALITY PROTEIN: latent-transforming growth factor beta-binding protein 4 n=1 Tax=Patagioenas fasciata TaxID=372321 RepID=UPI003A9923AD